MSVFIVETRYDPAHEEERLAIRPQHLQYLDGLMERHQLANAGPLADGTGAVLVYLAKDRAELDQLMAPDPYPAAAVRVVSVREWRTNFPFCAPDLCWVTTSSPSADPVPGHCPHPTKQLPGTTARSSRSQPQMALFPCRAVSWRAVSMQSCRPDHTELDRTGTKRQPGPDRTGQATTEAWSHWNPHTGPR